MSHRKIGGETTAPDVNVNKLIKKAKKEEITIEDITSLADNGKLSSSDFAKILFDGFDPLKGIYPHVGVPINDQEQILREIVDKH